MEGRSIGEKLEGAQRAGDLRLRWRRTGIDFIIASGVARSSLRIKGSARNVSAGLVLHRLVSAYEAIDRSTKVSSPSLDRKEQRRRVLIRLDLPMLDAAREEVRQFAVEWGQKRGFDLASINLPWVVKRSVEVFLDDVCDDCHGTKVIGVYGGVQLGCKTCKGTGTRSATIGRGHAEQEFAVWLALEMKQMLADADSAVSRALYNVDHAKQWLTDQTQGAEYVAAS